MFDLAFATGIFSYSIFILGIIGILYRLPVILFSVAFWLGFLTWKRDDIVTQVKVVFTNISNKTISSFFLVCAGYLVVQAIIAFFGLFGPEIGFDALWYHLVYPKIYLLYHTIVHIPGGVFLYSDLPKLGEMLFTAGLSFGSDFWARIWQFIFGVGTCITVYKVGRKFFSPTYAILLPVIFYSNLVVGWESISGYIDLIRTFFTIVSLWAFLEYLQTHKRAWLLKTAFLVGLTITTKFLAIGDVALYSIALVVFDKKTVDFTKKVQNIGLFVCISLLCPLPWFVFSFVHTGNPIFPIFSPFYPVNNYWQVFTPLFFLSAFWNTFAKSSDPINPLFLAIIPFVVIFWKKLAQEIPVILFFAIGGFLIWYFTPQTGGGRFILPYLPVLSIVSIMVISHLSRSWQKVFICFIFTVAGISLLYRGVATAKFIPVILHPSTKPQFMASHLQFNLGDFYDIDGYFAKHIKLTDRVLLYNFHNLYYVDFPFIDSEWAQKGDLFNYVAVQGVGMPERFTYWNLIYFNNTTQVRLYSLKGQTWRY